MGDGQPQTRVTMRFDELSPELQVKARECATPEEMLALAREEGMELGDEQLEAVSGGWGDDLELPPNCEIYHALPRI